MNGIISKDLKQGLSRRWEWIESEEKGLDFAYTRYCLDAEPSTRSDNAAGSGCAGNRE